MNIDAPQQDEMHEESVDVEMTDEHDDQQDESFEPVHLVDGYDLTIAATRIRYVETEPDVESALSGPKSEDGKKAVCAHEQRSALGADDARACGGSLKAVSMQCLLVLKVKRWKHLHLRLKSSVTRCLTD